MANWNPKIPLNFRIVVFCLLIGMVLSVPAGGILYSWIPIFTPAQTVLEHYLKFCGLCLLLLPGWICVMARCRWWTALFVTLFFYLLAGLMMPAVA